MIAGMRMTWRTMRLGASNVRAHKLRSFLTVSGIVFGVCSVISMLSIGEGASQEVQEQIRRLGSNNIIIKSVKPPQQQGAEQSRNFVVEYGLKYADAERLAQTLPSVEVAIPVKARPEDLWVGERKDTVQLAATVPGFMATHPMRIVRGRFLTPLDMQRRLNVCVLDLAIARNLFQYRDPIDSVVRLGSDTYRVVGLVATGEAGPGISGAGDLVSQTANCFIPLTTARARNGDFIVRRQQGAMSAERVELSELILSTSRLEDVLPTAGVVEETLKLYHPQQDYRIVVPQRLLEEARRTQRIFSITLGSIAAISLLVGGIGIMNIMLATVSERTREIGVRRALGARRRDILAQFLVETLLLSLGGGLLGMALGAMIPRGVTTLSGMRTVLTADAFILSFAVSAAVGVIFGLYPARRAAMMDPIDALRHE